MQFTRTNINKTFRNGEVNASNVAVTNVGGGGGSSSLSGNFLPAVNNGDGSYTVDLSKVLFTGSVISEGEVTAYGSSDGSGSTTTGGVTIIDGLDSVATDCALSANQGRILKELIDNTAGSVTALAKLTDVSLSSLTNGQILKYDAVLKKWVNDTLDNTKVTWTNIEGKPADLTDANITKWNENNHTHTNRTTLDKITETSLTNWNDANSKKHSHSNKAVLDGITSTLVTNWNTAYTDNHTHSNKSVLDGITSTKVSNWDGVVTSWNKAFYFDTNGDLKVKVNVIGEKEVSAYGAGVSGGSGSITIVDALTSTATDAALSANQGRILRELIDNVGGGVSSWNDLTDKPNWITDTKPSYSWSEIGSKPSTFTPSTHTHNYASTVKVGSTSYNVSGNTISLPAYPTVPSALKNPNALTISLNGTSQGAYDGSAAKSFNITAASVGAAASSHSHSISNVSGLQDALNGKAASSHNHNSSYVSALGTNGNYLIWTKNGTTNNITVPYASNADTVDGYHQAAFSMGWTTSTKYRVDRWGGNQDKNWKKIVTYINTGGGSYQSCKVKGTIYYITGNHNQAQVIDIPFEAIMYAYGGTANSMLNQSTLYLPPYCTWDMIRIVRYNNNSWEVQVRQPSDWTNISLEYTVTNNGGSVSAGQFTNTSYSSTVANNYNTNVSRPTSSRVSSADKVNSTLSFSAGGFSTKSFNGSSNQTVNIPTHTSHLTNNSGFITSSASISGNAGSATKLQTARTINGTSFNGTANITTANWGTTRSIYIQDATATNTSSAVSVNGGGNAYLKLPTNIKVGTLTATGEVTAYSDIRLKTDIQPLENRGYIKPVTYKKDGKDSIGFIAQEVRELYPELVIEDNTEDKYLSVNYAQYVAVLQAQIIELNNRVKQLEKWHYQVQE